jgi:hypothetical protein
VSAAAAQGLLAAFIGGFAGAAFTRTCAALMRWYGSGRRGTWKERK